MMQSGTFTFADCNTFEAGLGAVRISLVVTQPGRFAARATIVALPQLELLRISEELARVAFVSLPPRRAAVSFPIDCAEPARFSGFRMGTGDIMLHGDGEGYHQVLGPSSSWGLILLSPDALARFSRAVVGFDLVHPRVGYVVHAPATAAAHLLLLHRRATRLAATRPGVLAHPAVARALEQELLHTLVHCLADGSVEPETPVHSRRATVMRQCENALARPSAVARRFDLCSAVGVPARTLRSCFAAFLGIGPHRYLVLRRLGMVRRELSLPELPAQSVKTVAARYGFSDLGRFAAKYREQFDELPSVTLRAARKRGCERAAAEIA